MITDEEKIAKHVDPNALPALKVEIIAQFVFYLMQFHQDAVNKYPRDFSL